MTHSHSDESLPVVRTDGVSVEDVGDEILLYDRESDTAHCLTESAAAVWRACEAGLSRSELLARDAIDESTVERALDELREQRLLGEGRFQLVQAGPAISRRQAVGRLAAVAVGPLVISVAAPTAWAQSPVARTTCTGSQCPVGSFGCKQFSECVTGTSAGDDGKRDCDGGSFSCGNKSRGCCPNGMRCGGTTASQCFPATGSCPTCP